MTAKIRPFRLIITRNNVAEILFSACGADWSLPCAELLAGHRIALQLATVARDRFGLEAYCLWTGTSESSQGDSLEEEFAVMEVPHGDGDCTASGMTWIPWSASLNGKLTSADRALVRRALKSLDRSSDGIETGPFSRPGWIDELFSWVRQEIKPLGLEPTGNFAQLSADAASSLMRIETTGPAVWFKATGEPNRREVGITVALDHLFPALVPRVLAVCRTWNGWLAEEIPGLTLESSRSVDEWARAAEALAKLQIESVSQTDELVRSGCKDLRLYKLERLIDPFLTRARESMTMQPNEPPKILKDSEIDFLGLRLQEALDELRRCHLPSTLGHLDPNPSNIVATADRCSFLDWAEGSVTHPLFTFEYLREYALRAFGPSSGVSEELAAAYCGPWQAFCSRETFAPAMRFSPLLAVFACAAGCGACEAPGSRVPVSYFRALARRAHREARALGKGDRCLA